MHLCFLYPCALQNRSSGDTLHRVVQGQEAFFDHVPGRAAAGRPMHARTHRRPDEPDSDADADLDAELELDDEVGVDDGASASDADVDDAEAAVEAAEKPATPSNSTAVKKHHHRANRYADEDFSSCGGAIVREGSSPQPSQETGVALGRRRRVSVTFCGRAIGVLVPRLGACLVLRRVPNRRGRATFLADSESRSRPGRLLGGWVARRAPLARS